jgi:dienelactone hydrolase
MRFVALLFLLMSSCSAAEIVRYETVVMPLPNEDIASGCRYTLTIPVPGHRIRAVWVIFDRAHDVHDLYSDPAVEAFARQLRLALLLHGHCPGKAVEDRGDMNMDPSKGLGRALFTALEQFAHATGHAELSTSDLIFLGFSGAGPLSARLVGYAPDRAIAAILSAPGHFDPLGIDTVNLNADALAVPELIIAGGADNVTGTARPYLYFRRHRDLGAPWAFLVQNKSPHCCTANAKNLMLHWLEAIIAQRGASSSREALRAMDQGDGWLAYLKTRETDTRDSFGLRTFEVEDAKIAESKRTVPEGWVVAGWLPNRAVAKEWLLFVQQEQHPILPLH